MVAALKQSAISHWGKHEHKKNQSNHSAMDLVWSCQVDFCLCMRKARPWSQFPHHVNMFPEVCKQAQPGFCHCPFTVMLIMDQTICNEYGWAHCREHRHPFFSSDWRTFVFQAIKKSLSSFAAKSWGSLPPTSPRKRDVSDGSVQTHPRSR